MQSQKQQREHEAVSAAILAGISAGRNTAQELVADIKCSISRIHKHLSLLEQSGAIRRLGDPKTCYRSGGIQYGFKDGEPILPKPKRRKLVRDPYALPIAFFGDPK